MSAQIVDAIMGSLRGHVEDLVKAAMTNLQPVTVEAVIPLWASEIGSYLNRSDAWSSRTKALATVWRRTNDAHFKAVQEKWIANGYRFTSAMDSVTIRPAEAMRLRKAADPFPEVCSARDVAEFRKTASADDVLKLYRTKGHIFEDHLADLFSRLAGQPVELRNTAASWRSDTQESYRLTPQCVRPPGNITDPGPFTITGEVDGWLLSGDRGTIVEFKLRMNRIPQGIPERDKLQMEAYMAIHGVDSMTYVQSVIGTNELDVQTVYRDVAFWEESIMPSLHLFVCDVRKLLRGDPEDVELRHQVLRACTPGANLQPLPLPFLFSGLPVQSGTSPSVISVVSNPQPSAAAPETKPKPQTVWDIAAELEEKPLVKSRKKSRRRVIESEEDTDGEGEFVFLPARSYNTRSSKKKKANESRKDGKRDRRSKIM